MGVGALIVWPEARLAAAVAALRWSIIGWRGAMCCEVELDAGGGDAFLLAGQQGQRAGIGFGGAVQVQGAWPQPSEVCLT